MIAITGATGQLGRLVIDDLLERGVEPARLVAAVRSPEKASDLAERGMDVREADYTRPDTLESALEGVNRLLLISSSEVGQRFAHHRNVIEAAQGEGIEFVAYTSLLRADTSPMRLAEEHHATEELIRESGIPYAFLRNGWYIENYTGNLEQTLEQGALFGSAGDGLVSAAARADYAEAAAAVITGEHHEGRVYELAGDDAFTVADLADEISRQSGTEVVYRDLPEEEFARMLAGFGLPEPAAVVLADADARLAEGYLHADSDDLRRLIGRPTTPLEDVVAQSLSS